MSKFLSTMKLFMDRNNIYYWNKAITSKTEIVTLIEQRVDFIHLEFGYRELLHAPNHNTHSTPAFNNSMKKKEIAHQTPSTVFSLTKKKIVSEII